MRPLLAALAVLSIAGCGGGGTADATVSLTVLAAYTDDNGGPCRPAAGYDDIGPGTVLTLETEDGEIVDRAELDDGQLVTDAGAGTTCRFEATFTGVPDDGGAEYVVTTSGRDGEVLATGDELLGGDVAVRVGG